jgi:4,5-dihydroxyphthalate decarboxylase
MTSRRLSLVLDDYPHTAGVLSGEISAPLLELEPRRFSPVWDAFGAMVEEQAFDVSEMSLATYVLARAAGKPITLLPVTMLARFQHPYIVHTRRNPVEDPRQLAGRRVGVRSYTQTTGVWMRGILARQFDVEASDIEWVTFESPHVDGYQSPAFVRDAPMGTSMAELLDDGYLSAAIISHDLQGVPDAVPLFDDLDAVTREWYELTGIVQVNHAVCVRTDLLAEAPHVVAAIIELLRRGRDSPTRESPPTGAPDWAQGLDYLPFGLTRFVPVVDLMRTLCIEQGLVRADLELDELLPPSLMDIAPP